MELEEEEKAKHSIQGAMMQRELAEREQAIKNRAIIAKNNEKLRRERYELFL